jgi:hypothetical protein
MPEVNCTQWRFNIGVVNLEMQLAGFIAPLTIGFVIAAFDGSFKGAVWILVSFGVV